MSDWVCSGCGEPCEWDLGSSGDLVSECCGEDASDGLSIEIEGEPLKELKLDPEAIVEFVRNEEEANAMDIMFARAVTSENAQEVIDNTPRYTCPDCGMISYHPKDIENHYCGNCHRFEIDRGQQ